MKPLCRAAIAVALLLTPILILTVWFGLVMAEHAVWRYGAH